MTARKTSKAAMQWILKGDRLWKANELENAIHAYNTALTGRISVQDEANVGRKIADIKKELKRREGKA